MLRKSSPEILLESYHTERSAAADENIRESTRSTDFMAPSSRQEARLRQAVLSLAKETEFGKRMVNEGKGQVVDTDDCLGLLVAFHVDDLCRHVGGLCLKWHA